LEATVDKVKALVGLPAPPILGADTTKQDELIADIVGIETLLYPACAALCRRIASEYATQIDVSTGGSKASLSQRQAHYIRLADKFERKGGGMPTAPSYGGVGQPSAFTRDRFQPREAV